MNDSMKIENRWARAFVILLLTLGAIAMLFPFFWMISGSFKTIREITSPDIIWWPEEMQWDNYTTVLTMKTNPFGIYFKNSIIVAVANTVFTLLTTILGAFAFSRLEFKGRDKLFSILLATMMVPSQMYIVTNFITITRMNLYDSLWAQILPYTASVFYIYLLRQFFNQIPDQISWNAYLWPLMVTGRIEKRVLSIGLKYFASDSGTDYHLMMAGATIVVLPLIVIYLVFQKYIIQGIARGGLKG